MEPAEVESPSIVSGPVLPPPPVEEEQYGGGPPAVSEQVDASVTLPTVSEQVNTSSSDARQHSEGKTDKMEKMLASVTTVLSSLVDAVKQLQDKRDPPMPEGQSMASPAPDLTLALESPNQGEGTAELLSSEHPE